MKKREKYPFLKLQYGAPISYVLILAISLWLMPCVGISEPSSAFQQGVESVKLRLYPQAIDTFKSILSQHPTDLDALFQLGSVYRLRDELELAIETFDTILTLPATDRVYGLANLSLSEIYCKQSELAVAEQHAKAAVQQCPQMADTHYRLGYIYTHQAKLDKAMPAFKRALVLNPDFAEVYEWLGLIALMQDRPQQAVGYYQTAIQKKPYVQSAYYNLAKAYRLLGDIDAATEQLKRFQQMKAYYDRTYALESALEETPTNTELRMQLAEIHLEYKHPTAAIATYQALLRLNPDFTDGYDKLARLYMNLNRPRKAIPLFQKVLALNPNAIEAHVRLGWLYTVLKEFKTAESHLQTAIEKMPKLTLAYHGLAEIYTKQGRIEKAIEIYRYITQVAPNDRDAWKALRSLERLQTKPLRKP